MKYQWTLAMAMAVTVVAFGQKPESFDAMLGKGLHLEESERDCKGAIKIYQELIKQKNAPPNLAARAQLHIGMCQEQLGELEARGAYEKVLSTYRDQRDIVQQAQARLASLRADGKNLRRICAWGPDCDGRISPDGRLLAFANQGIFIRNLATGEARKIAEAPASDPMWSPDGKRLAYSINRTPPPTDSELRQLFPGRGAIAIETLRELFNSRAQELGGSPESHRDNQETYVINVDGSANRMIHRGAYLLAWSADGKRLLVNASTRSAESSQPTKLLWINVSDGTSVALPTKLTRVSAAHVSPDGRYVAVMGSTDTGPPNRGGRGGRGRGNGRGGDSPLYVLASDGSGETSINAGQGPTWLLGWNREGTQVLFNRLNGNLTEELWAVPLSAGKPQDGPVLLQSDWGGGTISIREVTGPGTVYFERRVGQSNIVETYTAAFDASSGKITSPPERLPSGSGHSLPHWSADGRRILFTRDGDFWVFTFDGGTFASGTERRLVSGSSVIGPLCWSTDEQSILTSTYPGINAVRLDLKTGETRALFPNTPVFSLSSCAGDLISNVSNTGVRIRNIKTGVETELHKFEGQEEILCSSSQICTHSLLSHNGRFVAFEERQPDGPSVFFVVSTNGGPIRELVKAETGAINRRTLAWSPDDRYIFYLQRGTGSAWELFRVPVTGGAAQGTGLRFSGEPRNFEFSPDGKRIAFQVAEPRELWATDIAPTK